MTDKVFISKENLQKALSFKEKKDVGFFTSICMIIWLLSLIPFIFGIVFTKGKMYVFRIHCIREIPVHQNTLINRS